MLAEVLDGLKIYFDFMLKDHLLYAEEKAQYECLIMSHDSHVTNSLDINGENQDIKCRTSPSTVYGYIHLLRLFGQLSSLYTPYSFVSVKLPLFLSKAQFPLSHIHILHQYFNGFLALVAGIYAPLNTVLIYRYLETKADELFSKEQYSDRQ